MLKKNVLAPNVKELHHNLQLHYLHEKQTALKQNKTTSSAFIN
jgi:hypothetical protein